MKDDWETKHHQDDPEGNEHTHLTWEDRNSLRIPAEISREDYSDSEWSARTAFWREGWDQFER
jgi:hypothetical protein